MLSASEPVVQASAAIGHKLDASRLTLTASENANRTNFVVGGPYTQATRNDQPRGYYVLVDANDGTLLFPSDSPPPLSPLLSCPARARRARASAAST